MSLLRAVLSYRISRLLFSASVVLVLVSAALNGAVELGGGERLAEIERLVDVVREQTVQSWFSTVILAAGSVLAGVAAVRFRVSGERYWFRWAVVSASLMWVSFDEASSVHELLNDPDAPAGLTRYAWVFAAVPVVVLLAVWMYPVLRGLSPAIRRLVIAAGIVFVGGAVGLETLSGIFFGTDLVYGTIAHGEEFLEMVGVVLFVEAMLRLLRVPKTESGRIVVVEARPAPRVWARPDDTNPPAARGMQPGRCRGRRFGGDVSFRPSRRRRRDG